MPKEFTKKDNPLPSMLNALKKTFFSNITDRLEDPTRDGNLSVKTSCT